MLTSELTVHMLIYCRRARLLSSHTRLFILSLIHGPPGDTKGFKVIHVTKTYIIWISGILL